MKEPLGSRPETSARYNGRSRKAGLSMAERILARMGIDLDTSRAVRRPSDLEQLVRAILAAHPGDEDESLEWKRGLPLGNAEGNGEAARYILGFANRDPATAVGSFEGHAYLLLGAEPGHLEGQDSLDPATLESWLSPYLGQGGPQWALHQVRVDGTNVVVFDVAPPRPGDPIYVLKREYSLRSGTSWPAGAIFVRHKGKTERQTPEDVAMLTSRAGATGQTVSITVSWDDGPPVIRSVDLAKDLVSARVEAEHARLLRPLEPRSAAPASASIDTEKSLAGLAEVFTQASSMFSHPEDRNPDDYRDEVDSYLASLREQIPSVAMSRAIQRSEPLRLRVENLTEANFASVRLELYVPGEVFAFDPDEYLESEHLPRPPPLFGTPRPITPLAGILPRLAEPRFPMTPIPSIPGIEIENTESARLTFPTFDLRPRDAVLTDPFHLFARPGDSGDVEASWKATSKTANGMVTGNVVLRVHVDPLTLNELLDEDVEPTG
jgi:hypothetical protein